MDLWPKRTTIWRPLASACLLITAMPGRPYPNAQVNPERRSRLVNTPTRHEGRILIDGSTSGRALMREKSTVHVSDIAGGPPSRKRLVPNGGRRLRDAANVTPGAR